MRPAPVARVDAASARLADAEVVTGKGTETRGEEETTPSGAGREMVENPRRRQRTEEARAASSSSPDVIPHVTLGGVPPPMSTVARDRLMRTMGAELRGGRLHQFEDPRIASSP